MKTLLYKATICIIFFLLSRIGQAGVQVSEVGDPKYGNIKIVYIIPMQDRLEHFLTNEIVQWGRFVVTLNSVEADALLTDTTETSVKDVQSGSTKARRTRSRTRGTAFLIDVKTERVIWSTAKTPSESFFLGGEKSARELAHEIVRQLKKDLAAKK